MSTAEGILVGFLLGVIVSVFAFSWLAKDAIKGLWR